MYPSLQIEWESKRNLNNLAMLTLVSAHPLVGDQFPINGRLFSQVLLNITVEDNLGIVQKKKKSYSSIKFYLQ